MSALNSIGCHRPPPPPSPRISTSTTLFALRPAAEGVSQLPAGRPAAANLDNAGSFAQLGDLDAAFQVLGGMISARRVMVVHMDSEPRLDPLRGDQRFEQLAKRVGLR